MLRILLALLAIVTDYDTVVSLSHRVLLLGLAHASVLGCIGVRLAMGPWLSNRHKPNSQGRGGK